MRIETRVGSGCTRNPVVAEMTSGGGGAGETQIQTGEEPTVRLSVSSLPLSLLLLTAHDNDNDNDILRQTSTHSVQIYTKIAFS
jgi:hypothetical protein